MINIVGTIGVPVYMFSLWWWHDLPMWKTLLACVLGWIITGITSWFYMVALGAAMSILAAIMGINLAEEL